MVNHKIIVFLIAACLVLSGLLFWQVKASGAKSERVHHLEQELEQLTKHSNDQVAQFTKDQKLIADVVQSYQRIQRIADKLEKSLNETNGCASTDIEPDVIDRVLEYRSHYQTGEGEDTGKPSSQGTTSEPQPEIFRLHQPMRSDRFKSELQNSKHHRLDEWF